MATADSIDSRLLRALRSAPESMHTLAARLGVSAPTLQTHLAGLAGAGYGITEAEGVYRLIHSPPQLVADDLCAGLPVTGSHLGREILVFAETGSTNDLVARAGREGLPGGLVIFAEAQRAGRGRLGRRWTAPLHHALLFSVLIRPDPAIPPGRWPELTFCAALAVARTAEEFTDRAAAIKWPNDVYLDGRKVAGILLERHEATPAPFVVMGIGLNVLQTAADLAPELRGTAGSLAMFAGKRTLERRMVATSLLGQLEAAVRSWPADFATVAAGCAERGCTRPPEELTRAPGEAAPR